MERRGSEEEEEEEREGGAESARGEILMVQFVRIDVVNIRQPLL